MYDAIHDAETRERIQAARGWDADGARRHAEYSAMQLDLAEMREAQLRREITDHIEMLRSELRIKGWLNDILWPWGLHVVRRPGRLFGRAHA